MARRGTARRSNPRRSRYPCGKLRPAVDLGNERVRAHREVYLRHGRVKAGDDLACALGQAHAAGLLEGTRVDGRVLLEHGKEWLRLYRAAFGGTVRTHALERIGSTTPSLTTTPTDRRYRHWAAIVATLSAVERRVLGLVCVEHGEGWSLPPFLARLINAWKARQCPPLDVASALPAPADRAQLEALKAALLALVEGSRRGRGRPRHQPG